MTILTFTESGGDHDGLGRVVVAANDDEKKVVLVAPAELTVSRAFAAVGALFE